MKRTLSLILIFLLIFTLSGCNRFLKNEETESHKETNEEEGTKATKSLDDMRYVAEFIHDETPSLEKCITSVTHVVEAKFIKRTTFCREENNYRSAYLQYMYEFEVAEQLP